MRIRFRFVVFCIVGSIAMAIDFLFFNIFFYLTHMFILSRVLGIGFSMIFNFNVSRRFTFSATEGKWTRQLTKFLVIYGLAMSGNVLVGVFVLNFLEPTQLNANIAAAAGLMFSIPVTFLGNLFWTFKKDIYSIKNLRFWRR